MMAEKNTSLSDSPTPVVEGWPRLLARSFAGLLAPLVSQRSGQSFERLQVVSLTIDMIDAPKEPSELNTTSTAGHPHGDQEFLQLNQDLQLSDGHILRCTLLYFVRGKRQFFRQAIENLNAQKSLLPAISETDVRAFYEALGQQNSALYDHELAQLAGRAAVLIPTQMLVTIVLERVLERLQEEDHEARHFHISFLRAIKTGLALSMTHRLDKNGLLASVETEAGPALYVRAI